MTGNETLRRMLDERGVKYWDMRTSGIWFGLNADESDHKYEALEQTDGLISIEVFDLTPAQAIAITVGSDKVEAVLRKLIARLGVAADFYFARKYVDCIVEEYAGKLATLGAGTCEADETDLIPFVCADGDSSEVDYIRVMECSACGGTFEHINGSYEFCPRCGRRIEVDE